VSILRPGSYRINLYAFKILKTPVTEIPAEKIGVVIANDGLPLPSGYVVAPRPLEAATPDYPNVKNSQYFQDGQAFLDSAGHRGPQLDTLQPGKYYINPLLFAVELYEVAAVPPGYVAVLRSNVGQELEKIQGALGTAASGAQEKESGEPGQPVHEEVESLLILDKNMRVSGKNHRPRHVQPQPTGLHGLPGSHECGNDRLGFGVDQRAQHTAPEVARKGGLQTSNETYDVTDSNKATEFFKFSQLRVTSMDGFQLEVDVRMIIRIRPQNAAFIIARFGSVKNSSSRSCTR